MAEIVLLALIVWPVGRVCATKAFLRKVRTFPAVGSSLIAFFTIYVALVLMGAAYFPGVLRWLAVGALTLGAIAWFRSRPSYGVARGLPPGSLAIAPLGPWVDDLDYQKRAARYGAVFKMNNFLAPMVCIVGLRKGADLLRTHDADLSVPPLPLTRFVPRGFIRYLAPAEHRPAAARFRAAFAPSIIHDNEAAIARICRAELERLETDSAEGGAAPRRYLDRLVFASFVSVFFGIDHESKQFARLRGCYDAIQYSRSWRTPPGRVEAALREIEALLRECRNPSFLTELGSPDEATLRNLIYMLLTAYVDVTGLLHWVTKMIADHPELVTRLRSDPSPDAAAERIVRETLRLEQSEYLMRRARRTIQWNGYVIPRGWFVRVCVRESHRSAEVFERPDEFDPDRFLRRPPTPNEFAPFGMSRIACLGEVMTLTVGRLFLTTLARQFDLCTVSDGPREYGGFHWQPSSRFRIKVSRSADRGGYAEPPRRTPNLASD
ncbi:MAG: cytochrome P450 [Tepidisphaeraceae bacterium]